MGDTKMVRLQTTFHLDFPVRTSFRRFFGSDPVIGKANPMEVPVQCGQPFIDIRPFASIGVCDNSDEAVSFVDRQTSQIAFDTR